MRRTLSGASRIVMIPLLLLAGLQATDPGSAEQSPPLAVPVPDHELRGLDVGAVRSGELRIVYRESGPTLELDGLDLDESLLPPPRPRSRRPLPPPDRCFLVTPFEHASRNRLGGRVETRARPPALITAELAAGSDGSRALRVRLDRPSATPARLAIALHDPEGASGFVDYLDLRPFASLGFRTRAAVDLEIGFTDARSPAAETARGVGDLAELTTGPDGEGWSWVRIPVSTIPSGLDRSRIASLVLTSRGDPALGEVFLDDLQLCPEGVEPAPAAPAGIVAGDRPLHRGLWVWSTRRIAADPAEIRALVRLLTSESFDRVYLQLPGSFLDPGAPFDAAGVARWLGPTLDAIAATGARIYALDGAPDYALATAHSIVLESIDRVAAFNQLRGEAGGFAGVHYDIEPYLLDDFSGPGRDRIVREYVELLGSMRERTGRTGLQLEMAIPFWFDGISVVEPGERAGGDGDGSGRGEGRARERGAGGGAAVSFRALSDIVIDATDAAVIMDYRTRAGGGNGTLAHVEAELVHAGATGGEVLIALETGSLPDEELIRFGGETAAGLPGADGEFVLLLGGPEPRLVLLEGAPGSELRALASRIGVRHWPVSSRIPLPAARLTFAELGVDALRSVLAETAAGLRRHPGFAGFAIHHYDSYRRLLDRDE